VQHLSSLSPCLTPWCDVPFGPSQLHYENNELHTSGLIGHLTCDGGLLFCKLKRSWRRNRSDDPEGARFAVGFFIAVLAQYPMNWKRTFQEPHPIQLICSTSRLFEAAKRRDDPSRALHYILPTVAMPDRVVVRDKRGGQASTSPPASIDENRSPIKTVTDCSTSTFNSSHVVP
jgi:hypothetical protein